MKEIQSQFFSVQNYTFYLSFKIILTTTPMIPKLSRSLPWSSPTKYTQQEEKNNYFTIESSFQG
jgi:hypothetical protein